MSHYPPDTAVPMPDDITDATPQQFADWHAAESAYQTGIGSYHLTQRSDVKAAGEAFNQSNAAYAVSALTRALMEHAPDKAAEVVAHIQEVFVLGDTPEWVGEWLHKIGVDALGLKDAGAKATWPEDGDDLGCGEHCPCGGPHPAPAPRDSDLTRVLREQMKRYGPPAVAAEVARLIQQRL